MWIFSTQNHLKSNCIDLSGKIKEWSRNYQNHASTKDSGRTPSRLSLASRLLPTLHPLCLLGTGSFCTHNTILSHYIDSAFFFHAALKERARHCRVHERRTRKREREKEIPTWPVSQDHQPPTILLPASQHLWHCLLPL